MSYWALNQRGPGPVQIENGFSYEILPMGVRIRTPLGGEYMARHPELAMVAEIRRLSAALTLAANRLDVLALDHEYGTTRRNTVDDWAKEARAALGPYVRANPDRGGEAVAGRGLSE